MDWKYNMAHILVYRTNCPTLQGMKYFSGNVMTRGADIEIGLNLQFMDVSVSPLTQMHTPHNFMNPIHLATTGLPQVDLSNETQSHQFTWSP